MTAVLDNSLAGGWTPTRERVSLPRLLRAEVRWIFRRPRTLIVLGLLTALPVLIGVTVALTLEENVDQGSDAPVFVSAATSALALPLGTLMTLLALMLPLTVAMAGGDAIAGEQAHGSLRGWLLAPVARGRLLAVKAFGVFVVALASSALIAVAGVTTGLIINGTDGLTSMSGTSLSAGDALLRLGIAVGWATLYLMAVGAVALAVSACTEHPMLVVVGVLGGIVVSQVLLLFSSLDWLHPFLLPQSLPSLVDVLRDPMTLDNLGEGALRSLSYVVIGLGLAYARVVTRDG